MITKFSKGVLYNRSVNTGNLTLDTCLTKNNKTNSKTNQREGLLFNMPRHVQMGTKDRGPAPRIYGVRIGQVLESPDLFCTCHCMLRLLKALCGQQHFLWHFRLVQAVFFRVVCGELDRRETVEYRVPASIVTPLPGRLSSSELVAFTLWAKPSGESKSPSREAPALLTKTEPSSLW